MKKYSRPHRSSPMGFEPILWRCAGQCAATERISRHEMWSAAMNIRVWLRSLGLGRYEKKFRENRIDFDVLADLTEGDLEELGAPVGDRRRLLRAIAELAAQERLPAPPRPAAPPASTQSFAQLDSGERRPITVMFCDLVGSTELA